MYFTHDKYPLCVNMKLYPIIWGWLDSNIGLEKYQKSNKLIWNCGYLGVALTHGVSPFV